jgi:transposase
MDTTTMIAGDKVQLIVGLDLSKHYFQVAVADLQYRMVGKHRLTREKLARFMSNHPKCQVVMEACGTSNYWARRFMAMGHEVKLLPAQYVKAYVKRNKTDAADAQALIEASRSEMRPVPVKTLEQQQLQQLHRFRARWQADRTARINGLRGCLREFGIDIPKGALTGIAAIREALEIPDNGLPDVLRPFIEQVLKEIADISEQVEGVDRTLKSPHAQRCRGPTAAADLGRGHHLFHRAARGGA